MRLKHFAIVGNITLYYIVYTPPLSRHFGATRSRRGISSQQRRHIKYRTRVVFTRKQNNVRVQWHRSRRRRRSLNCSVEQ